MEGTFLESIYHETQEPGSMLCGQHALNNLLQTNMWSVTDLGEIARQLDEMEAAQLDPGTANGESNKYDDSGFFSLQVMEGALKVLGLRLVRWKSQEMRDAHDRPERMEAFLLNQQLHWYPIRRFGASENRHYNLDSCIPSPEWISPTYLGMWLREAELKGYSIFAVLPSADSNVGGLPSCEASELAPSYPPPSQRASNGTINATTAPASKFQATGNVLGSAPVAGPSGSSFNSIASSSAITTNGKGVNKRPPVDMAEDDDLLVLGGITSGTTSQARSTSSVEEESEKRRRRRRIEERELPVSSGSASPAPIDKRDQSKMTEEEQMALAIAESLRASKLEEEVDDDVVVVESTGSKGKGRALDQSAPQASTSTSSTSANRGQADEDAEFEAALKASLLESGAVSNESGSSKPEVEEAPAEEEEDSPSMEELRRRRLARFG